mgnify:CR=1 FL=1
MSVRVTNGQHGMQSNRLYDVLAMGLSARPTPPSEVYTSEGALIGHAEVNKDQVYVFTSPDQLRGVRVHPPFRVASAATQSGGLAAGLAEVLSGALGR